MLVVFNKKWRGIKVGETLPLVNFGQMSFNGRQVQSVVVKKTYSGGVSRNREAPISFVTLFPEDSVKSTKY